MAAHGAHRWSWVVENKVLGFGSRFWEKMRVKIVFFTLRTYL